MKILFGKHVIYGATLIEITQTDMSSAFDIDATMPNGKIVHHQTHLNSFIITEEPCPSSSVCAEFQVSESPTGGLPIQP